MLDGHIHIRDYTGDREVFSERIHHAGASGGLLVSLPPDAECHGKTLEKARKRLDSLLFWSDSRGEFYPFFWIDPTHHDALQQVDEAVERGVSGFKVICTHFYPYDDRPLELFSAIAERGKPILFHSGILWDGCPSSRYNRPEAFEGLLAVPGLRFSLAHLSWPWCDDCIAVYGKFQYAWSHMPHGTPEMYIDLTPGTPVVYRKEALTKLFKVGYDVGPHVIFGSDSNASDYNVSWVKQWLHRDQMIFDDLELSEDLRKNIFEENLRRFVGATDEKVTRKPLRVGE